MPPGPAALVKPVPCCVPRLQPCCPAKEVISQQRQVTLSFFLFFFSFIFFSSFPFPPSPPSSVFSAPRTPGSSEQAANLSAQHNTSPPGGKEKKKKKKENQTLRTARRRAPFGLWCPSVPAAPPAALWGAPRPPGMGRNGRSWQHRDQSTVWSRAWVCRVASGVLFPIWNCCFLFFFYHSHHEFNQRVKRLRKLADLNSIGH